jgi:hypothetical protein
MSTFAQLADRVEAVLHGYTENTEPASWLTTSATSTTTSLTVYDASVIGRGYVQIDDEIVFVNSTDNVSNVLTVAPWGRAQRGTTAAAHDANSKVTMAPLFPRQEIKNAINNAIDAMYPSVFAIGSYDFDYVAARYSYGIPATVENVLSVTYSIIGPSKEWFPARAWQLDRTADSDAFATTKSLSIYSEIVPGQTVHVTYSKRPTLLTSNEQEYSTVTGFPSYSEDVVIYGAAFRMISFLDPSRLGAQSAAADILDGVRPNGSGQNAARFLFNIYQQRLNEVANNQRRQYPIRSHYQR